MKELNLEELMELYKKTTQGEWKRVGFSIKSESDSKFELGPAAINTKNFEDLYKSFWADQKFTTEIHNSFPAIYEKLKVIDKENQMFKQWIYDGNCPFPSFGTNQCPKYKSCQECVLNNISEQARQSIKKEGVENG